jgi:hypothetical protein
MSDTEEAADGIDDGIELDGAPARRSGSIGCSARKGTRSGIRGPQNVPHLLGVKRKVITAATAAALNIDVIDRIPVPAQFGSRPDAPADCLVLQVHDPDPSANVKDWQTGFGTSKTVASLRFRVIVCYDSQIYSPRMPPMPYTSLTAQVSTHTLCALHASRPLLSRLAHCQKNHSSPRAPLKKNLSCSGAGSPHCKLSAAKRACSSVLSNCEALTLSCSLPALLNMRSTPADEAGRPRCCLAILASVRSPPGGWPRDLLAGCDRAPSTTRASPGPYC